MKTKPLLAACAALALASCATSVAPNGTKTTKPDKSTVNSLVGLGREAIGLFFAPAPVAAPIKAAGK